MGWQRSSVLGCQAVSGSGLFSLARCINFFRRSPREGAKVTEPKETNPSPFSLSREKQAMCSHGGWDFAPLGHAFGAGDLAVSKHSI